MMTPSSSAQNTTITPKPRFFSKDKIKCVSKTLSQEFFSNLARLETAFYSKNYSLATLDDLVQQYARAVEYYDSIQDKITSYFTYKIQDVLSTRQSLKMLLDKSEVSIISDSSTLKSKIRRTSLALTEIDIDSPTICQDNSEESSDGEGDNERKEKLRSGKKSRGPQSLASMKNQKQRFVDLFQKVETAKVKEEQNVQNMFNKFNDSAKDNDAVITSSLENQKSQLKRRLAKRKNDSFLSFTLNSSINSCTECQFDSLNNSQIVNVLNELNIDNNLETKKDEGTLNMINKSALNPFKIPAEHQNRHLRSKSLFSKKNETSGSRTSINNVKKGILSEINNNLPVDENKHQDARLYEKKLFENSFNTATLYGTNNGIVEVDDFVIGEANNFV